MAPFLEKTLEAMIYGSISEMKLRGLDIFYQNTQRQFRLPSCKKVIDILTWEVKDEILFARIIELKKENLGDSSYWQLLGYYVELLAIVGGYFKDYKIELVLIGAHIDIEIKLGINTSEIIRAFEYQYGADGIWFKEYTHNKQKIIDLVKGFSKDEYYLDFNISLLNATQ